MDIEAAVAKIMESYKKGRDIDAAELKVMDKKAVKALVNILIGVIFPILCDDAEKNVGHAAEKLTTFIGEEKAAAYLGMIPGLREIAQTDVDAAFDGDPAAKDKAEIILCYPGLFAVTVYRLAHAMAELEIKGLPRMMTEYAHSLTGIDIHPGAVIGPWFFIDHGTGIVIGETTVIGSHVKIYQGVTLGGLSTRGGQKLRNIKRHPTIGDCVTVYANASILGGDTVVGDGCVIGAGAFITGSVAANTTVTSRCQKTQLRAITE